MTCPNGAGVPPCWTATVQDFDFSAPVACMDNGGANGANCSLSTTFDTLEPGTVRERQRQVMDLLSFDLLDAGADGSLAPSPADDPLGWGARPSAAAATRASSRRSASSTTSAAPLAWRSPFWGLFICAARG